MQVRGANNPPEAARRGKTPIIQKKAVEASKNAMRDLSAGWLAVVLVIFTAPPENQSATVYSPDGEQIAHYNSGNIGGWINLTTRAENQFLGDFNDAYKQARDVARAEMNAPKTSAQSSTFSESTVDFRA